MLQANLNFVSRTAANKMIVWANQEDRIRTSLISVLTALLTVIFVKCKFLKL
jgi:hypothetical protein